jgi:hypothetical protein
LTGAGGASGYWGSFWSNQDQSAANTTTAYPITFNNTDPDSIGVSIVSNSQITFANAGVYNIQFSAQADRVSGSGSDSIDIWFRKNGTDIPESNGVITVAGGAAAAKTIASWNYMLKLSAGDYVELAWRTSDTNLQLIHEDSATSPTRPAIPSVIVTAQQVMNTQLGPQGATGATGATISPQIDIYTGSTTWTKPANAKQVIVECVSGGGGGGYGGKGAAGTALYGGAGGGAGGYSRVLIDASELTEASYTVTVGSGGNGGIGATLTNATLGTFTRFIGAVQGQLAGANAGGTVAGNGGGSLPSSGSGGSPTANAGGASNITTTGGSGTGSGFAPTSGGAGGGLTAAAVVGSSSGIFGGGSGGNNAIVTLISSGGAASSVANGVSATSTAARTLSSLVINGCGGGGGGACSFATGSGGNGANGTGYGSGGGGGGSTIGSGDRSNGGNGTPGVMVITTYF